MKKLLSILLALVMAFALAAPALAVETGQTPAQPALSYDDFLADFDRWWAEDNFWGSIMTPEEYVQQIGNGYGSVEAFQVALYGDWLNSKGRQRWEEWYCAANAGQVAAFDPYAYWETIREGDMTAEEYMESWGLTQEGFKVEMRDAWLSDQWSQVSQPLYDAWDENKEQLREQAAQKLRDEFITAHGGVPGQFNLMVNGKFLTFPAERPLYQAKGVTYVDAKTLSEALGVEVAADEKGYAAASPAAKAAGYQCFWDKEYNAGVFVSTKAMSAEIDKGFTVFNRLLARNTLTGAIRRSVGNVRGDLTLFDTIDGNKTAGLSYAYDVTESKAGVAGTVDYDLSALWTVLEGYIAMPLDGEAGAEELTQTLELVRALMKGKAEVRMDLEQQTAYFSMPVLFRALNSRLAQSGVQLVENSWITLPLEELGLDMDALPALPETAPTVGSLLCTDFQIETGDGSAWLCGSIMDSADQLSAFIGDGKFTRKGDADVLTFTREDLLALAAEDEYLNYQLQSLSQLDLTLSVKDNGDAEVDFACRLAMESGGLTLGDVAVITVRAALKGAETEATVEYHLKNTLKLTATSRLTRSTPDAAPSLTPPKGAAVFDVQKISDLLEKMDTLGH